jgi:two-component system, sensor histidine kinase
VGGCVVVDDQRDVALAVTFALEALGQEVHIAHDAASALAAIVEFAPEVVLIDLIMPRVDGWELARAIHALGLATSPRLIAMSGFFGSDDRARSAAAGFAEHLVKPIGLADLVRLVEAAN